MQKKSADLPTAIITDLGNWLNGKMVLYLEDLLRLFAIARVANPENGLNLVPKH